MGIKKFPEWAHTARSSFLKTIRRPQFHFLGRRNMRDNSSVSDQANIKRSELRRAISEAEEPDKNIWDSFLARMHHKGNLQDCRRAEKVLSDLGSDEDHHVDGSRRRKTPKRYSPSTLPDTESPQNSSSVSSRANSTTKTSLDQASDAGATPSKVPSANLTSASSSSNETLKSAEGRTHTDGRTKHKVSLETNSGSIEAEEEPGKECKACKYKCPTCGKFQRKVIRLLHRINVGLTVATEGRPVVLEPLKLGELTLPLRTIAGIKNAEESVTPEFIDKLKHNLKQYVANTAWKTAVEMMRGVMTVSLMRQLNWEGRNKGKVGFAKIAPKLSEAITDAAKEVTIDNFKAAEMREKLIKVLVKENTLEEKSSVVIVKEGNGCGQPTGNAGDDTNGEELPKNGGDGAAL